MKNRKKQKVEEKKVKKEVTLNINMIFLMVLVAIKLTGRTRMMLLSLFLSRKRLKRLQNMKSSATTLNLLQYPSSHSHEVFLDLQNPQKDFEVSQVLTDIMHPPLPRIFSRRSIQVTIRWKQSRKINLLLCQSPICTKRSWTTI